MYGIKFLVLPILLVGQQAQKEKNMATKNMKQQSKTSNIEHEHVEPKNTGSKATKSEKTTKGCKNCK